MGVEGDSVDGDENDCHMRCVLLLVLFQNV